jgi:hypothetical protein
MHSELGPQILAAVVSFRREPVVSDDGLITTIRKLLAEDAGLSSDGAATNNVGSGRVAGLGVPPNGEPGA